VVTAALARWSRSIRKFLWARERARVDEPILRDLAQAHTGRAPLRSVMM